MILTLSNPFKRKSAAVSVTPQSSIQSSSAQAVESSMSTAAVTPVVKKPTFLQHLGSVLMNILHIGEEVAIVAAPEVELAFPAIAPLYGSAIGLAVSAEATAAGASGTGAKKLASMVPGLTSLAEQFAAQNNLVLDDTKINAWASSIADSVNMMPFSPKPATPAPTA